MSSLPLGSFTTHDYTAMRAWLSRSTDERFEWEWKGGRTGAEWDWGGEPFLSPGMTESLMQKDSTWKEVGRAMEWCGLGRGGYAETLGSHSHLPPPPPTPSSLNHICLLFSATHLHPHPPLTFSLQFLSLFPAALMFFRSSHFSTPAMLWQTYCSGFFFFGPFILALTALAVTVTPCGPSYMQIRVCSIVISIILGGSAISWLHALKQLNFAPPPSQQSFADVLGEI